jgi:hypothetical protein
LKAYGVDINNWPRSLPGDQQRILMDGLEIPLDFENGLSYLWYRKPPEDELVLLPQVLMTSFVDWDPCIKDDDSRNIDAFHDPTIHFVDHDNPFDYYGEYRHFTVATCSVSTEDDPAKRTPRLSTFGGEIAPNYKFLDDCNPIVTRRMDPKDMIGWTFLKDAKAYGKRFWTQVVQAIVEKDNSELDVDTLLLYKFWRTALHQGPLQTSYKEFVNTLEDYTREWGAMDRLNSEQILQALCISSWYSERYQKNQNFAENRHGTLKTAPDRVLNFSGAPANTRLLALMYVCLLLNHLASAALGWKPPLQVLNGQTSDILEFQYFSFFELAYYQACYWIDEKDNPADIVSKHWGYQQVWQLLKPLLFYSGNTLDLIAEDVETAENIESLHTSQESL